MNDVTKIWRIIDIIRISEETLKEKRITNARLNVELMLANTLNTDRLHLYLDFEKPLSRSELDSFREKLKRRLNYEPLQYILGFVEFYGLKFKIIPGVLIPRQETELLVDCAVEIIKTDNKQPFQVLEIGAGSGCISIAIAKNCECIIDAMDISEKSILTSIENSKLHGTTSKINFNVGDINSDVELNKYDLIISNPPYVPIKEFEKLPPEIKKFEPREALTDEKDGFSFYRKIFSLITCQDRVIPTLLEIGDGKSEFIRKLLYESNINFFSIYKDLIGIDRVLEIK
jgi:release factor glutamine methyltransferase